MSELVTTRIRNTAVKLDLPHLASGLDQFVHRAEEASLGYLDFLDQVLEEELAVREDRRFRGALRLSKLPHHKTLEDYDFSFQPDLDPRKIRDLATLSFVEAKANAALLGPPGVGKTHAAVALAVAACRAGFSVYFTTLDDMVRNLRAADEIGRLGRKLQTYLRPQVLVVDEVGYQPLERAEANLVFQVVSKRYEGLDHPDLEQDLQRMGTGVRRRSPRDSHPRQTPAPLSGRRHQRAELPPQEPPHRDRRQLRRRMS